MLLSVRDTIRREFRKRKIIPLLLLITFCFSSPLGVQAQSLTQKTTTLHSAASGHTIDSLQITHLISQGEEYLKSKKTDSAIPIFEKALQASENTYFVYGIISSIQDLCYLYTDKGFYDILMDTLQHALVICNKSAQLAPVLPVIYTDMGNMYKSQSKYELAVSYYLKAISLMERVPDKNISVAATYNNLASVLMTFERDSEALYYLNKAEQEAQKVKNYEVLSFAWGNKGIIYMYQKDWEQSKHYLQSAIMLTRKYSIVSGERFALVSMSNMYLAMEVPGEAISYSQQALSLKGDINPYYQNLAFRNIGVAYFQLHDYKKSKYYLLNALGIAKRYGLVKGVADTHQMLSDIYSKEGLYKEAFEHVQASYTLEHDIQSEDVTQNLNQLEVKYRTSQKDKEILGNRLQISQQENHLKQKNIWIVVISAALLFLITLLISLYRINAHRQQGQTKQIHILQQQQEILEREKEIIQQEQEIEQLRAMMQGEEKERTRIARELHDGIGGMLAAINMNFNAAKKSYADFSSMKELSQIMEMVEATTEEVRKAAYNLMPNVLLHHTLSEVLETYCEQVTIENQLHIDFSCDDDIIPFDKSVELMIYRIIQELIQNIIKHAKASHAIIEIEQKDEKLSIIVEDNGIGFDTNKNSGGFGLQNLRFRIKALQGDIAIKSEKEAGTIVSIVFNTKTLTAIPVL